MGSPAMTAKILPEHEKAREAGAARALKRGKRRASPNANR